MFFGLFTAANPDKDLECLVKEFQALEEYANTVPGVMQPMVNRNATEAGVFKAFLSRQDIRLFHYSGHAGERQLHWDDGNFANGDILSAMMSNSERKLKLVFLNACATYDLVDGFLRNGAKVVIATQAPVYDVVACEFSKKFYENLFGGANITASFNDARRHVRTFVEEKIKELGKKKRKLDKEKKEDDDYTAMLEKFLKSEKARASFGDKPPGLFEWAIYYSRDADGVENPEEGQWTVQLESDGVDVLYPEPGIELVKSLAKAAAEIRPSIQPADPRCNNFDIVARNQPGVLHWGTVATTAAVNSLGNLLLLPMQDPFNFLANHCSGAFFDQKNITPYKKLLELQVELYRRFVRTATAIMMADLFEAIVDIYNEEDQAIAKKAERILKQAISATPGLKDQLNDLTSGNKSLDNLEFDILVIRNISACLKEAADLWGAGVPKMFKQFVGPYAPATAPETLQKINHIHQVFTALGKIVDEGKLEQANVDWLMSYCDKAEDALISLFNDHKYALAYEMMTVGAVEAVRPRQRKPQKVNHELYTNLGTLTVEVDYKKEFAEHFSVVLVSSQQKFPPEYLSLSPLIINLAQFVGQTKLMFFFFNGVIRGGPLHYLEVNEKKKPNLKISNRGDVLEQNPLVLSILKNKDPDNLRRVESRFSMIGSQYDLLETRIQDLISA